MAEAASSVDIIAGGGLGVNITSFGCHLQAENESPRKQPVNLAEVLRGWPGNIRRGIVWKRPLVDAA